MEKSKGRIKDRIIKLLGGYTDSDLVERCKLNHEAILKGEQQYTLKRICATAELDAWEAQNLPRADCSQIIREGILQSLASEIMPYVDYSEIGVSHYGGRVYRAEIMLGVPRLSNQSVAVITKEGDI